MRTLLAPSLVSDDGQQRVWPFAAIALVAVGSILLPPGPAHPAFLLAALAIAVVLVATQWLPAWRRRPAWATAAPLLPATAAIGMLIYSAGTITGLTALLLLPVFYSALYGRPREALLVIPAVGLTLGVLGVTAHDSLTVLVRLHRFACSSSG